MAAEKLYLSGSYKQCHQLLSSELEKDRHSLQTLPFRDTLILMNNKLTCKLKLEESIDSLERITEQYYMLWQLMIGLPESCDYHVTQSLMVACNVLSCFIRLWLKTGQSCHINKSMEFIKQIKINEDSTDCYMRRLLLLRKLLELITTCNTGTADFVSFLGDKRDHFQTRTQSDIEYEKVHQLYIDGHYSQCIDLIHKSKTRDTFTGDSQTLLLANCYAHNGLHQLSLHYYYRCLQSKSSSILIHKLAATNACTVYQVISNADAEMKMRRLLLELLKEDNSPQHSFKDLLVWRHRGRLETNIRMIGKDWLVAGYEFVLRSKDIKNYSQASSIMTQLLHITTQQQLLSETLPSLTDLTLLACHTHLMARDVKEAENVLSGFPITNNRLHTDPIEEYGHILILWYQSLLHIAKGDMENASSISVHCLQTLVQFQERAGSISEDINLKLLSLKRILLNNCAVFAVAKNSFSHAHSLLTTSISLASDHHGLLSSYNYCLLLIKLGKVKEGCKYWLEENKHNTRKDFKSSFRLLTQYSNTVLLEKQSFGVIES